MGKNCNKYIKEPPLKTGMSYLHDLTIIFRSNKIDTSETYSYKHVLNVKIMPSYLNTSKTARKNGPDKMYINSNKTTNS